MGLIDSLRLFSSDVYLVENLQRQLHIEQKQPMAALSLQAQSEFISREPEKKSLSC
jgi:hypothetical protein